MTSPRHDFLALAGSVPDLLRDPAVGAAWPAPSALAGFSVSGLAGHLAYQVLSIPPALAEPVPSEPVVPLLGHYERVEWIDAGPDDEINVRIRKGGESEGALGAGALADRVAAAVAELATALASVENRPVRIPLWGPWSLLLDDFLTTRMMEIAVHGDDLAVSVGIPTPRFAPGAVDTVVGLLSRLAVRRHGQPAVLRALSRAERAPGTIAAF
ncbi:maleylpyruvate isomerase N-terminal domain-containing protein [Streptomyces crystallinus]|uniref:Mycothiol-dependent maleylpyruvate isomerase metal-binding domain-containing protein n=1 Tax=Streptomyces crystallinus TaxID=68191 RepID=A0ABP3Q7R4_9ACTN